VIGGAGSIGSSFISALLPFKPSKLVVIDLNENGLAELTRDLRSTYGMYVPEEYRTYTLNFADPIFERIFREEKGFDIVANFSAHKHVRSEKDKWSVQALIENNVIKAKKLMDLLTEYPPKHFFCVSTDKAANPVNIMGASKRIMEDLVMAYSKLFPVTTARFANVAFSNGSLPDSWMQRMEKKQPLSAPNDVKRYFVSLEESGQICMLACILGKSGEVFFPKLGEEQMLTFSVICDDFVKAVGRIKKEFATDEEAKKYATEMPYDSKDYPVVYFKSDTTGEKAYEEFYVPGEQINLNRFKSLGVIEESKPRTMVEVEEFFEKIENIFHKPSFTKEEVVEAIKDFIPNFEHEEKWKNLDQKM
jgi:FlaA1/EpsC-like NDP-sugar epimerase